LFKYSVCCALVLAALQIYCLLHTCSCSTANVLLVAHLFSQHCRYIAYCALFLAALQIYCLLRTCSCSTANILLIAHLFLQHCTYFACCAFVLAALQRAAGMLVKEHARLSRHFSSHVHAIRFGTQMLLLIVLLFHINFIILYCIK